MEGKEQKKPKANNNEKNRRKASRTTKAIMKRAKISGQERRILPKKERSG